MNLREIDLLEEQTAQRQLVEKDELNRKHVRERDVIKEFRALAARSGNGRYQVDNGQPPALETAERPEAKPAEPPSSSGETKKALIVRLIGRKDGATNDEIIAATGWVINSVRGQISALRKEGYRIESDKRADGKRAYFMR